MKNFIKKLAFVMAFAMILTSLTPAAPASAAASDLKMNRDSKNLYLGESDISGTMPEYDFYIKNKPSNYKKLYSFKWTSSNPKVATVDNAGLTTAVTTGTTTITCTITSKETGKIVKTTSAKVTVKQNAKDTVIYNYPDDQTAEVGETVNFNRKMTPKTGKGTATDKTKWVLTNNTAGAKVTQSNGKVTTTKAGSYTITAYTYQSSSYPLEKDDDGNYINYTSVSEPVTITVIDPDAEVTPTPTPTSTPSPTPIPTPAQPVVIQQSVNSFKIVFGTDMSKTINKNNLTIRGQSGINQYIKDMTFSEEGKVVLIDLYNTLINKNNYTISYDDTTLTFTASVGEVAMIELTGVKDTGNRVAPGETGVLEYTLRDANGVIVPKPWSASVTYEILNDDFSAFLFGDEITFWDVNRSATVVATYHTGTFSTVTGMEITYTSNPFTVYCLEPEVPQISGIAAATISPINIGQLVDFTNADTTISLSDEGTRYLVVKAVNTAGEYIYLNEFTTTDNTKLIIDNSTGMLYPVATGVIDIICWKDGQVVGVVPVTVTDYRTPTILRPDQSVLTLSNSDQLSDTATVTFTLMDQFGNELPIDSMIVTKLTLNMSGSITNEGVIPGNTITFYGSGAPDGMYQYRVTVGSLTQLIKVTVKKAGSVATTRLSVNTPNMDMKITAGTAENRYIIASLNGYDIAGTKVNAVANAAISVIDQKGSVQIYITDANGQIKIPVVEGGVKLLTPGTYHVSATIGNTPIQPVPFIITDSQPAPSVSFSTTIFEVPLGTYIYNDLTNAIKVTSNAGADSVFVEIDDDCVTGTIKNGYCSSAGPHYLAIKKVYITETFGSNVVKTTHTFTAAQVVQITVK